MANEPEFFEDEAGQWRYRVRGANGEIMVTSEGYPSRENAERGLRDLEERIWNRYLSGDMEDSAE